MKTKAHFTLNRLMRLSLLSFLSAGILSANPVGDYRFQDSLENALGPESPLANIGSGNEFANENVLGRHRRVLKFPAGGGVLLDNLSDLPASSGTYTVAILFRLDTVSSYRKILDFKNRSLDSGFYCRSGNANFYAPYHEGDGSPITAGDFVTVVLARDAADKVVRAYVNGEEQFSFIDSDFRAVVDGNDRWIFFQDDTPTGGPFIPKTMGGKLVRFSTGDPEKRRLLNIVEEMAVASGMPMPHAPQSQHELKRSR